MVVVGFFAVVVVVVGFVGRGGGRFCDFWL